MHRLIVTAVLVLSLTTACAQHSAPAPQAAVSSCEDLLPLRHAAREATRQGQVWTPEQEAIGRAWNAQCNTKEWASRLAWLAPKDCTGDCGAGRPPGYYSPYVPTYYPTTTYTHCTVGRYFSSCTTR
jgi:hypothetical protein